MTTPMLQRKRVLLAKIESTYGTDSVPTGALNAIQCRSINLTPMDTKFASRDLIRPYLGNMAQLPAAIVGKLEVEVEWGAGTGASGTAPPIGPLLRGAGMAQTLNAAAVTGSAVAGGSQTITLAAGASSVNNIYRGLPITITSGTGAGQTQYIAAYNGTTKVATVMNPWTTAPAAASGYSIGQGAVYSPVSDSFEALTTYLNVDSVLHKFVGARGSLSGMVRRTEVPAFKLTYTGLYAPVTDSPLPTVDYSGFATPLAANATNTPVFSLFGVAASVAPLSELSFDLANQVVHRPLIGEESVIITDRKAVGQVTVEAVPVATRDFWALSRAGTLGSVVLEHGTTGGNIVAFGSAAAQLTEPTYTDEDGVAMLQAGLTYVPTTVGNDELFVTFR